MTPFQYLSARVGQRMTESLSPYGRWLAGTLLLVEPERVQVQYEVRPELCNPLGLLHGGAIGGLVDDCIGILVFSLGEPDFFITLSLNTDYLSVAQGGSSVIAEATLTRRGTSLIHAECVLRRADDGSPVARSTSILMRNKAKTEQFWQQLVG